MKPILLVCALTVVVASGACGKDAPAHPDYVIPPTTKIADAATRAALTAVNPDGSLKFSRSTSVLASLAVGDILNSNVTTLAPYGLLRKVTAIDRSDCSMLKVTMIFCSIVSCGTISPPILEKRESRPSM